MAHSHLEQEKMQQTIRERLRPESVEAPANQLDVPEAQGGTRP